MTVAELNTVDASFTRLSSAPYFEQYLGVWALRETELRAYAEQFKSLDLTVHLSSERAIAAASGSGRGESDYRVADGVAVIELRGSLMKQESSFGNNTSTVAVRRMIRAAAANQDIKSILLQIDSPGGTVAGTKELADDVAAANQKKPVFSFIEDLGASAAYWVASQAGQVFANETGLVGSIGTYGVVQDLSGLAAKEGIKVHVVRAGSFKGMGTPGTEITSEHIAEMQRTVNALNAHFLTGVVNGRKMEADRVSALADGRVHIASEAKQIGLIDAVMTFEQAMERAISAQQQAKPKGSTVRGTGPIGDLNSDSTKGIPMSESQQGPKPATIAELKAECVGAGSDFVLAQAETGATIEQAKSAWSKVQAEQIAQLKAENEKLAKEKAAVEVKASQSSAATTKKPGAPVVENVSDSASEKGNALDRWNSVVAENRKVGMSQEQAILKANRDFPGLRSEMVSEVNAGRKKRD